jgi:hypothetical protein
VDDWQVGEAGSGTQSREFPRPPSGRAVMAKKDILYIDAAKFEDRSASEAVALVP